MFRLIVERHATHSAFRLVDPGGADVKESNEFLASLAIRGLSPRTTYAYAFDLLALHRWLPERAKELRDLDAKDLLAFVASQQLKKASPSTINRRLMVTRLLVRFLTGRDPGDAPGGRPSGSFYKGRGRDRLLGLHQLSRRRPLLTVKMPRKVVEPLTPEEVRRFFQRLRRYRDVALTQLLLFCGLRSCEILAARLPDIVFDQRRILVRGKGQKERVLPLPAQAADAISRYLRLERPPGLTHDALFVVLQGSRRGRPMTEAGLRTLFRQRRRLPGLARANAHRFRHTFGADMARAGVRLPTLQKMMGHENCTTTLKYVNLSMADIADAYSAAMEQIGRRYDKNLMGTF